jgi:hypothetical protein
MPLKSEPRAPLRSSPSRFTESMTVQGFSEESSSIGAMTDSFIKAVEAEPGTTYGRLLSAMRARIRDGERSRRLPGRLGSFVRWMIPSSSLQVSFIDLDGGRSALLKLASRSVAHSGVRTACLCRNLSSALQRCLTSTGSHSSSEWLVETNSWDWECCY